MTTFQSPTMPAWNQRQWLPLIPYRRPNGRRAFHLVATKVSRRGPLWVAGKYDDFSLRKENCPFSFHEIAAPLEPDLHERVLGNVPDWLELATLNNA